MFILSGDSVAPSQTLFGSLASCYSSFSSFNPSKHLGSSCFQRCYINTDLIQKLVIWSTGNIYPPFNRPPLVFGRRFLSATIVAAEHTLTECEWRFENARPAVPVCHSLTAIDIETADRRASFPHSYESVRPRVLGNYSGNLAPCIRNL